MHSLKIIAVGKIKQSAKYLETGIELYKKRLSRYARITLIEIPDESPSPTRPVEQVLEREAESILKLITPLETVVLLSERGRLLNSAEFANWFSGGNPLNGGRHHEGGNPIIFIIGGAYGTSSRLERSVSETISLSPLTFPHQMVRLLLLEQLYRACTIINNEPYHK